MDSTQDSLPASSGHPLPAGFLTLRHVRDKLTNEEIQSFKKFVSVIGFVEDYQEAIKTSKNEWKCSIKIKDHSIATERGMVVSVFAPQQNNIPVYKNGDLIVIRDAKVQMLNAAVSLLTHYSTRFHVLSASSVPNNLAGAQPLPWTPWPASHGNPALPKFLEANYIIWAIKHKMELGLPSDDQFEEKRNTSTNIRTDKFSLLKDVQDGLWYNILGEIVQISDHSSGNPLTVYLSDYTPNAHFYNHVEPLDQPEEDDYGYSRRKPLPKTSAWPGPYGKMSIQLSLWDDQANFIRGREGEWVLMKNVHIKMWDGLLEGSLKNDHGKSEGTILVDLMRKSEDPDPRYKEAVRRKLEYNNKAKARIQGLEDGTASSGNKRKPDEERKKPNSKQRRKEQRAAALQKAAETEAKTVERSNLNANIRCSYPDEPTVSFSQILKQRFLEHKGENHVAPYTVCKYRANVRVVDYFPHKLEDFAVGYRSSEYEMLSDYSGNEDSDPEEDRRIWGQGKGFSKDTWEWRFALQVEDASTKDCKDRLWLIVDNHSAQLLLDLEEDATSLRSDKKLLNKLREQLFKLWGDLEEQKSAKLPAEESFPSSTYDSIASSPPPTRRAGDQPDADDSDVEMDNSYIMVPKEKANFGETMQEHDAILYQKASAQEDVKIPAKNKPFTCCIRQYGIKVKENDSSKADALNGDRWQRMFGLFGTQIM